jgi:hypothetical protein
MTVTLVPNATVDILKSSSRDEIDQPLTMMRCVNEYNNDRGKNLTMITTTTTRKDL